MASKRVHLLVYAIVAISASTFFNVFLYSKLTEKGLGEKNILVKVQHSRLYIYTAVPVFRHRSFEAAEKAKKHYNVNAIAINAFAIKSDLSLPFKCCFMLQNGTILSLTSLETFSYHVIAIRRGIQLFCPLRHSLSQTRSVSLAFENNLCPTDEHYYKEIMNIKQSVRKGKSEKNIAVCAKLSYGNLDDGRLVEWLETLRLSGVDRVFTHAFMLNSAARKVYQYYGRTGFTEVMEFDIPEKEIVSKVDTQHRQGWNDEQVALFNCQAKLIWYDYVIIVDTDEFLLPKTDVFKNGWRKLFEEVFQNPTVASAYFWSSLHITSWGPTNPRHPLFIGKYSNCTVPLIDREKQVYIPTKVVLGSIDTHANIPFKGYNRTQVDPERAIIHHYRACRPERLESRLLEITPRRLDWMEGRNLKLLRRKNDTYFFNLKTEKYCYDFRRFYSEDMEKLINVIKENVRKILINLRNKEYF